jgi:small subunit ribosomal protein S6
VREYELVYIIQPDATPEREKEIHSRIDDAIARAGGTFLLRDDWGKRKLAFEIRKFQKGHYVLAGFLGEGAIVDELERGLRLDPDVLRFLTVKVQDEVRDIEGRITRAREEEAERARRREERERLEAERAAARQAAADAAAARAAAEEAEAGADEAETEDAGPDEDELPPSDETEE